MSTFRRYAKYYDLLYKDKDYRQEAEYIDAIIKNVSADYKHILDMGCGSGEHLFELAKREYFGYGVDKSGEMINRANLKLAEYDKYNDKLVFIKDDIRTVKLNQTFDAILSLFHVFSYQTRNKDIISALKTARTHLNKKGILVFDSWYGPAVLSDPPVVRIKRMEDERVKVTRIAEPVSLYNNNCVEVNFTVFITDKQDNTTEEISESHMMRYFFKPEMVEFLSTCNFHLKSHHEWITQKEPGADTWGTTWVAEAV